MKRAIKAWYTGEPSSTDLGQAISENYKRMKEKYSPFDISNWYIMKPSLTSNGYSIELEFGRGDMYQWILRKPESYREGYKLYGPFDVSQGEHVDTMIEMHRLHYMERQLGTYDSLDAAMSFLFTEYSDLIQT